MTLVLPGCFRKSVSSQLTTFSKSLSRTKCTHKVMTSDGNNLLNSRRHSVSMWISILLAFGTSYVSHLLTIFISLPIRDTVDSVGLVPRNLPFTTSNTLVRTFRHALSLDERRAKYKTNLWNRPRVHETTDDDMPRPGSPLGMMVRASSPIPDPADEDIDKNPRHKRLSSEAEERVLRRYEQLYAERQRQPTDAEEVWFAVSSCRKCWYKYAYHFGITL